MSVGTIRLRVVVGAVLCLSIGVSGCIRETKHPELLSALKADPLSRLELPNATLERSSDDDWHRASGKTSDAQIHRVYHLTDAKHGQSVLENAVLQAKKAGWSVTRVDKTSGSATKQLEVAMAPPLGGRRTAGAGFSLQPLDPAAVDKAQPLDRLVIIIGFR